MAENRMLSDEILLGLIKKKGSGGGTTDYEELENLPQIAGIELKGDKSIADLGIASAQSVENITNGENINDFAGVEAELSNMQTLDGVVNPSGSVGEDKNLYIKLSGSLPSAMKVTSLKFEVTARRGGGSGMIEYSRLGFYDADGNKYNWPQGTTWSSNVRTAENDPIGSSKMLQYEIPAVTTINLPEGEYIDTYVYKLYGWYTGNDTIDHGYRDPVGWKLYLSEDKTNYILRDERSNQTITTSRNTLAFKDEFNILPPGIPSISDIFYKKGGIWLKDAFAQQSEVDAIKDGQNIDSFADVEAALAAELPSNPSADGSNLLRATTVGGETTKSWVSENLFLASAGGKLVDCNTETSNGIIRVLANSTNMPSGAGDGVLIVFRPSTDNVCVQMFIESGGKISERINWYGTWSAWKTMAS